MVSENNHRFTDAMQGMEMTEENIAAVQSRLREEDAALQANDNPLKSRLDRRGVIRTGLHWAPVLFVGSGAGAIVEFGDPFKKGHKEKSHLAAGTLAMNKNATPVSNPDALPGVVQATQEPATLPAPSEVPHVFKEGEQVTGNPLQFYFNSNWELVVPADGLANSEKNGDMEFTLMEVHNPGDPFFAQSAGVLPTGNFDSGVASGDFQAGENGSVVMQAIPIPDQSGITRTTILSTETQKSMVGYPNSVKYIFECKPEIDQLAGSTLRIIYMDSIGNNSTLAQGFSKLRDTYEPFAKAGMDIDFYLSRSSAQPDDNSTDTTGVTPIYKKMFYPPSPPRTNPKIGIVLSEGDLSSDWVNITYAASATLGKDTYGRATQELDTLQTIMRYLKPDQKDTSGLQFQDITNLGQLYANYVSDRYLDGVGEKEQLIASFLTTLIQDGDEKLQKGHRFYKAMTSGPHKDANQFAFTAHWKAFEKLVPDEDLRRKFFPGYYDKFKEFIIPQAAFDANLAMIPVDTSLQKTVYQH